MTPPLVGIRAIEVGNYMAGPFCGMQLADLGAEVVKVENPAGGDMARLMEPIVDGESGNFARLNRGKKSLAVDLKSPEGKRIFRRLASRADVVVENLRPGTMRDLDLDPADLMRENARLVYCAVTGWGQDGPYADRPALDIVVQGKSGIMSITGEPEGPPVKVGVSISDLSAALYATIGILAALRARERDGRGQLVDISMFESSVALSVWEAGTYFTTGEVPRRMGTAHKLNAPYQAIASADGHFIIGATTPRNWSAFCRALGLERLESDARFTTTSLRRANLEALIPLIEEVTRERPMAHWLTLLREAGVPCGEIATYDEVFTDRHLAERGFFVDLPHPKLGKVRSLASPVRLGGTPVRLERAGPRLGEHSREVLTDLGYAEPEIGAFARDGVISG